MARIALWLALAALAAVPVRAAEETAESATTQALAHAARAKVHYDLGEYERAAEEYILVYRIKPRPGTLFNIAQSYRKAGQYGKAKQFYESYLRETPETKNRAVVEKAIKEIDGLLAKEKRAKDGPPQGDNSGWHATERAQFVAIGIAKISEIHLPGGSLAHSRRVFDRRAAIRDAGLVPCVGLFGIAHRKADRPAVGGGGRLAVDRL